MPLEEGSGPEGVLQGSHADVVSTLVGNQRRFLAFLEKRLGNRDLARDVLQAAFVKGIEKAGALREHESAVAWFFRLLRNAATDHARRRGAAARATAAFARQLADPERASADRREICACVSRLARTLKPEYADVLRQVEVDGVPLQEFAAREGITPGNAAVRAHRARAALHKQVIRSCGTCAEHGCEDCSCGATNARRD